MANNGRIPLGTIQKIKLLRSSGYSLPEISKEVGVSKTSVLRYIKNVQILPQYLAEWAGKRGGSKKIRLLKLKKALNKGEEIVSELTGKEKLLILCALYWAEGNKKDFILTNSDPQLIRIFVNGLRQILNITNDQIRISLRLYEDLDREKSLAFWSNVVGIAKEQFLSIHILPGKKKGKLEYGMCRVRVIRGGDLLKEVMGINQIIANRFVKV
ncbi:hypothetical protein HYU95_01550 [Candidatus Daviesbacteria bacterium]|nr:hypothetical protein [Candidatus Daviesbacteria bacterium]